MRSSLLCLAFLLCGNSSFAQIAFTRHAMPTSMSGVCTVSPCDIDKDGDLDVIAGSPTVNQIYAFQNSGAKPASFGSLLISSGVNALRVRAADMENDGDQDIVASCSDYLDVHVYANNGAATPSFAWTATVMSGISFPDGLALADLNKDSLVDAVTVSYDDGKVMWHKNNTGSFTNNPIVSGLTGVRGAATGDIDNDGDIDIVVSAGSSGTITLFRSNGATPLVFTQQAILNIPARSPSNCIEICDINGDGRKDILSPQSGANAVYWYQNNGGTPPSFTERLLAGSVNGAVSATAADIDRDGDKDVVTSAATDGKVAWQENIGGTPPQFVAHVVDSAASGARELTTADLDKDVDQDIILAAATAGQVHWYENVTVYAVDIAITKTSNSIFATNGYLSCVVHVQNKSATAATNVQVTDQIPAPDLFVAAQSDSRWVLNGNQLQCTLASIAAGTTIDLPVVYSIQEPLLKTVATVSSGTADANPGNNSCTTPISVGVNYPRLKTITALDPTATTQGSVRYMLGFSKRVTGFDISDLRLKTEGAISATIQSVTASNVELTSFTVTLAPLSGEGKVWLEFLDNDSIVDSNGDPFEGIGARPDREIQPAYTIDHIAPQTAITALSNHIGGDTSSFWLIYAVQQESGSGIYDVDLWYRKDATGDYKLYGTNLLGKFSFEPWLLDNGGEGTYELYTTGRDAAGNRESPPAQPDLVAHYDISTGVTIGSQN